MATCSVDRVSYTINDVIADFPGQVYIRGKLYAKQGLVTDIKFTNYDFLVANVKGTERRPYNVEIHITNHKGKITFNGICSCPIGGDCKHVVATLLEGINQFPQQEASSSYRNKGIIDVTPLDSIHGLSYKSPYINDLRSDQLARTVKEDSLDSASALWLENLNKAVMPILEQSSQNVSSSAQKVLIYTVKPSKGDEAFIVAPISASVLKSGIFSSQRKNYRIENVESYNRAKYVTDNDVTILRLISAVIPYSEKYSLDFKIPAKEEGLLLLKLLIESNRCYLENEIDPNKRLSMGDVRNGFIEWKIDESGSQSTNINIENTNYGDGSFILKFEPLYYVCSTTKTVGILETGLAHKQATALLKAPRIKPKQSAIFYHKLSAIFGNENSKLLPEVLPIHNLIVRPIPCLKLTTVNINVQNSRGWVSYLGEAVSLPVAVISFDYEGKFLAYNDSRQELSIFKELEREVLVIPRNQLAEMDNIEQLFTHGLNLRLKDLNNYYSVKSEYAYHVTIGEQKENFHKDKKLAKAWMNFMGDSLPLLKEKGWKIELDKSFPYNIVYVEDEWYAEVEENSGINWFSVELGVYIEGKKFNLVPILLDLLKKEQNIFTIIDNLPSKKPLLVLMEDGRNLALPSERAKILLSTLQHLFSFHGKVDEAGKLRMMELEAALLAEMEASAAALNMRWYGGDKIRSLGKELKDFKSIKKTQVHRSFKGQLRAYQQDGLDWLQFLREYNLAGILADDMGLGKTVQALAHIATEKAEKRLDKPVLIVATTSLMVNWKMEIKRFVPDLKVLILHGSGRKAQFKDIKEFDLILTTYPLLPRDKDALLAYEYNTIILDEAQNIKNTNAKITQIVNQIKAKYRICMTGTPLENHLGELWSLFNFLLPGYLGNKQQFGKLFRIPIEKEGNLERSTALMKRIKPFILRRTKQEVITELPPKTEIVRMVELEGVQRDLYETIRSAMYERVKKEISKKGMEKSHIIVLDALLKLRQVCCDPALLKMKGIKNIDESAKRVELLKMLNTMMEEGRKVLLFSQFTSMLELIENELVKLEMPYVKLTGDTKDRETPIRKFQEGNVSLFLISLKAGGVGLNLTAADTVIHYDPWWNPAVENQATDRAHRIGQDKPVFVYKIITAGTVEEKIVEMQVKKRKLMDSLFDPLSNSSVKLSANDIQTLFEPLG